MVITFLHDNLFYRTGEPFEVSDRLGAALVAGVFSEEFSSPAHFQRNKRVRCKFVRPYGDNKVGDIRNVVDTNAWELINLGIVVRIPLPSLDERLIGIEESLDRLFALIEERLPKGGK